MSNRRFPFSGSGSGERLKFYPNMKAIIAEKPSVGMDIARVVGATDKKDGYCTGNGYMVTWALGHLVSLAMPGAYGYTKTSAENLPMLPDPFRLVSRQVRTDKGMVTDIAAAKQLKIIDSVFDRCDSIIVATDCAREGELIFRWIYSYLGYTKPFKRLWISSLTDEAIREGLANLRDGSDYDSLYAAADCRAKADWLVGMNASRALAVASGSANNSIGRVQTPTLAMVCARFKENRNFVSTPYWQLHLTLKRQDAHRMFIHTEEFKEKDAAEAAYRKITSGSVATVTGSEHKRTFQQAPLLYDLTTLQKDCNVHVVAPGREIWTTDVTGGYTCVSGTSFAAPHVSGIVALIWATDPDLSVWRVRNIIEQTTRKIGGNTYGVDPLRLNGLWNQFVGYGLVNAYAAVSAVSRPAPTAPNIGTSLSEVEPGDLSMMGLGYDKWNIAYLARGEGQATCSIENYDSSVTYVWSSTLPPYTGEGFTFTVDFASDTDEPVLHDIECRVLKNGLSTSSGVHLALIPQGYSY